LAVSLDDLTSYLDEYLRVAEIPDAATAWNGLQVQGTRAVERVVVAVDACRASIDAAIDADADLLLVHHGLLWDGGGPITGRRWRRFEPLLRHGVAVYAAHLPLDCHPEVGNNALLARAIGLGDPVPFGNYQGTAIGLRGTFAGSVDELAARVEAVLGCAPLVFGSGPVHVSSVGVVTGAGGSMIDQAITAGLDAFVTGEGAHHTWFDAVEGGIHVLYGGHYATETFGVRALGQHLAVRFGLTSTFFDYPTGL